jgi:hypothetical protein
MSQTLNQAQDMRTIEKEWQHAKKSIEKQLDDGKKIRDYIKWALKQHPEVLEKIYEVLGAYEVKADEFDIIDGKFHWRDRSRPKIPYMPVKSIVDPISELVKRLDK